MRRVIVAFRFDDYSRRSPAALALTIAEAFRRRAASITFSAIPFDREAALAQVDIDVLADVVRDGTVEVALHGCTHESTSATQRSEFAGLPYEQQLERIDKGRRLLEALTGSRVSTFVPPWNRYDVNTIRALQHLGFATLSANTGGEIVQDAALNYLPQTCDLRDLRDTVATARRSPEAQPVVVVCFHAYDFLEVDAGHGHTTLDAFVEELDWLVSQPDVRVLSIAAALRSIEAPDARRYLVNRRTLSAERLLPPGFRTRYDQIYSRSVAVLLRVVLRLAALQAMIAAACAAAAFAVATAILGTAAMPLLLLACAATAGVVVVTAYARRDSHLYYRGLMISSAMCGVCVGAWLRFLSRP